MVATSAIGQQDQFKWYTLQNKFNSAYPVRKGQETPGVEQVGGTQAEPYQGGYDYSVPDIKAPNIDGGTHITGLGGANDTGLLRPYLA